MLRKIFIITVLFVLAIPAAVTAQVLQPNWLTLPQHSAAMTDDALALFVNPAGLGVDNGPTSYFLLPYSNKGNFGDWGLAFEGDGLAYAMEVMADSLVWQGTTLPGYRRRHTLGLGGGEYGQYFGVAYSWTTRLDRQNSWDIGYLSRTARWLSIGIVARGVNEPHWQGAKTPVAYDLGLAVRPLTLWTPRGKGADRLTLFFDAKMHKFDAYVDAAGIPQEKQTYTDNIDLNLGANWQVVPGFNVHFDFAPELKEGPLKHDARVSGGVSFNFGNGGFGAYQREAQNNQLSGVAYLSGNELYKKTIFQKPQKRFVEIVLKGDIVEYEPRSLLFRPRNRSIYKFHKEVERLTEDVEVCGILLKIENFSAGFAKRQEMRNALMKFKAAGKKIVVYMESGGNGAYYLATVADKIYLPPASGLDVVGIAAQALFVKGTLNKIGIEPQLEHIGDYKSASDMFTRESMSPAQREATDAILDDFFDIFIQAIADGRGKSVDDVKVIIDQGPFSSEEALKHGLIDSIVYEDQLSDLLKTLTSKRVVTVPEKKYLAKWDYPTEWFDVREKKIAIVYGLGSIVSGESSSGGIFGGETMGSATIARALKQAREDKEVTAVVFRVDSPGGSGLASEMIMREVKRYKEGDNKKPIIVSMSDVAGSGGYYVACMADTIVALPTTITGSIGVISGKFAVDGLYKKIALNQETLKRGKFADMYWASRSFTDEEWSKLRDHINQFYQLFLQRVAEGRAMDTAAVNKIAQGRIWSGADAKENGLIDATGGLDLALDLAAKAGGIKEGEKYKVKFYPRRKHELNFGSQWMESKIRNSIPLPLLTIADRLADEQRWNDGEILMLMPYQLEIK